jgi:hypothetical protein
MNPRNSLQAARADATAGRRVRDPYADLLRDSRGLKREQAAAREAWFAGLAIDGKEEVLFEFEMLLKGIVAWGDVRNHPVPRLREPLRARNFAAHLGAVRAAVARAVALAVGLGGSRRPRALARQLNCVALDDRGERPEAAAETPEQSLLALEQGLRASLAVLDGLAGVAHLPFRTFLAAVVGVQREIARSAYFNPLLALEFRPEFDRVRAPDVLAALAAVEGDAAHRFVTLAYLGALRLLRVASLARAAALGGEGLPRLWTLCAALCVDARALATALQQRAPALLGEALERELMRIPAAELRARFDAAIRDCEGLRSLQAVLFSVAATLRAEARRLVKHSLPPCTESSSSAQRAAVVATEGFTEALQGAVTQLTVALRGMADPDRIFQDPAARRTVAARLRERGWMFSVITRAFRAEAAITPTDDAWRGGPDLTFARDYLRYFRTLGRAVALETGYPHTERLAAALHALCDHDALDAERLAAAVREAEAFALHLDGAHATLSQRDELQGHPFDRLRAAETLRMHLGAPAPD